MQEILAVILAGGKGERLYPLTRDRSKPAVPFGGIYRIIDATLNNCIHSRIYKIMVFPQYRGQSLVDHIEAGWNIFNLSLGHFIKIVHAQLSGRDDFYKGTADSVRHNLHLLKQVQAEQVLVLSADHIYRMDYRLFERFHVERDADASIAVLEVPVAQASRFGVLAVDDQWRITGFEEKPDVPCPIPGNPDLALASMGIYMFKRKFLFDILRDMPGEDFGKHIIPQAIRQARVCAYPFSSNVIRDYRWLNMPDGSRVRTLVDNISDAHYWKDVGDLDAYWQSNMDLTGVSPNFSLYGELWPLRTFQQQYPPVKTVFNNVSERRVGSILDSVVSPGCIISGGSVMQSVLSYDVRVNSWAQVEECVLLAHVEIGRNCQIRRAIIDKHNSIPPGTVIGHDPAEDMKNYQVTPGGIVIIPKGHFRPSGDDDNSYSLPIA